MPRVPRMSRADWPGLAATALVCAVLPKSGRDDVRRKVAERMGEVARQQREAVLAIHERGDDIAGEPPYCGNCFDPHGEPERWPCPAARAVGETER